MLVHLVGFIIIMYHDARSSDVRFFLQLLLRNSVPALIRRCVDWPATITHVPVAAVLVLNTPDDGRLRPKHAEWLCRNKTCTMLHQVGVSFDLYYDARKHKIKIYFRIILKGTNYCTNFLRSHLLSSVTHCLEVPIIELNKFWNEM